MFPIQTQNQTMRKTYCKILIGLFILINQSSHATQVIHVFVALCDNVNQGIVPVPTKIGNGQDPNNNLYWGCGYGVRTYFKKDDEWTLITQEKPAETQILERCVFKHKTRDAILVAEAYDGSQIKLCIEDFFRSCSGKHERKVTVDGKSIDAGGSANLVCYVGHDGLMDFSIDQNICSAPTKTKDAIMLACISQSYFSQHLKKTGANPILWTTGLMAPEAYTLEAAIAVWLKNGKTEEVRNAAAGAYSKYQKCSVKAALRLLVSGYKV